MLSRLVIAFLPRSKCLLISWMQSPPAVILPPKIKSLFPVSPSICLEVMGPGAMILVFFTKALFHLIKVSISKIGFLLFFLLYFFLFPFIFIHWRLITLQYCSGFCHTLTWISHGFTCVPHPNPPSRLPLHPIPLGLPSTPALSTHLMHPTWAGNLSKIGFMERNSSLQDLEWCAWSQTDKEQNQNPNWTSSSDSFHGSIAAYA